MNNKGVSAVVANVLIVLLVVAAVAILWAIIGQTIGGAGDEIASQTTCQQVSLEITGCDANTVSVFRKAGGQGVEGKAVVSVEGGDVCTGVDNLDILGTDVIICSAQGKLIRAGFELSDGTTCEIVGEEFNCASAP